MDGSGDQVILATASYDHFIKLWQAHTGICLRSIQHEDSQVNDLEITPDKQLLAAAGFQHIRMYDINAPNSTVIHYDGIQKNVSSVGFQEDGKWMYTGGEDCSARIWDLRSRNLQCQRIFQVSAPVNTVCLHPNQAELVVGDQSGTIHLWDLKTDHNEQLLPEPEASIQCIAIDPQANYMAAINIRGKCYVWSLSGGLGEEPTRLTPKAKLDAHKKYGLKCLFSPDSSVLVTTSADQSACIWRTSDFTLIKQLRVTEQQRWVWDAAFSADSQYLMTASSDGVARLWNVETGQTEKEYIGHTHAITALAFRDYIVRE